MTASPLQSELWLANRLGQHDRLCDAAGIFDGATTPDQRRERLREAITQRGLATVLVGRNRATGKPESYAEAFERLYGEPLDVADG